MKMSVFTKLKDDYLAVTAPGFHILIVASILFLSFASQGEPTTVWTLTEPFVKRWKDYWPLYLVIIFLVYLLGYFIRAIPVRKADKICKKLFAFGEKKGSLSEHYYRSSFPYYDALDRLLKGLRSSGYPEEVFTLPPKDSIHTTYNFFKSVLCSSSPNSFYYTQALESRVRLFSGMFWSGLLGTLGLLTYGAIVLYSVLPLKWELAHSIVLFFSAFISILFGSQLPRIRGQEVEYVFLSYLAHIADRNRAVAT